MPRYVARVGLNFYDAKDVRFEWDPGKRIEAGEDVPRHVVDRDTQADGSNWLLDQRLVACVPDDFTAAAAEYETNENGVRCLVWHAANLAMPALVVTKAPKKKKVSAHG